MSEKKKSWLLNSIWLITIVPLAIAWYMASTGTGLPGSTKNKGQLMPSGLVVPQPLIDAQEQHWGIVVVSDRCEDTCQQQVYRAQQLYLSMGKHAERLQTVWVSNDQRRETTDLSVDVAFKEDGEISAQDIDSVIPVETQFQKMAQVNDQATFQWFKDNNIPWKDNSIFFVDPNGVLVLRFDPQLLGRDMMSDIKWLLKASRLG
jgi:cytochrome oxidase Cu insertion factor (SCO1/SenC/PrrC family)